MTENSKFKHTKNKKRKTTQRRCWDICPLYRRSIGNKTIRCFRVHPITMALNNFIVMSWKKTFLIHIGTYQSWYVKFTINVNRTWKKNWNQQKLAEPKTFNVCHTVIFMSNLKKKSRFSSFPLQVNHQCFHLQSVATEISMHRDQLGAAKWHVFIFFFTSMMPFGAFKTLGAIPAVILSESCCLQIIRDGHLPRHHHT